MKQSVFIFISKEPWKSGLRMLTHWELHKGLIHGQLSYITVPLNMVQASLKTLALCRWYLTYCHWLGVRKTFLGPGEKQVQLSCRLNGNLQELRTLILNCFLFERLDWAIPFYPTVDWQRTALSLGGQRLNKQATTALTAEYTQGSRIFKILREKEWPCFLSGFGVGKQFLLYLTFVSLSLSHNMGKIGSQ